jgi:hypothetical protein
VFPDLGRITDSTLGDVVEDHSVLVADTVIDGERVEVVE